MEILTWFTAPLQTPADHLFKFLLPFGIAIFTSIHVLVFEISLLISAKTKIKTNQNVSIFSCLRSFDYILFFGSIISLCMSIFGLIKLF